jgi:hypothetical protein
VLLGVVGVFVPQNHTNFIRQLEGLTIHWLFQIEIYQTVGYLVIYTFLKITFINVAQFLNTDHFQNSKTIALMMEAVSTSGTTVYFFTSLRGPTSQKTVIFTLADVIT